jgi:lipopolysaccharide export system protein LptA
MRATGAAALAAACLIANTLAAQDSRTRCDAVNTDSTRQTSLKMPSGEYNSFFGAGVVVVCPAKRIHLRADSAEQYGDQNRFYLVGHVYYQEPRFTLHSDLLNYYMNDERVVATGNVDATMPNGSNLKGPVATYLRPIPNRRALATMSATGRPTIALIEHDSTGRQTPPMNVVANNVFMNGDSLVYAGGAVQITREALTAHSDSMFLDGQHEILHLIGHPEIEGRKGENPFTLVGTLLDLYSHQQKLQRVLARGQAVATSKDLTLHSDTIDFRVDADVLQRAMAWGPDRAAAKSPADSLLADSIDVIMPDQRAREIHAIGDAYAESKPDSVKFHTKEVDWMRGDTILALFDTIPPKDTTQAPRIRQLVAVDSARAFYNMAPRDTSLCVPATNYSRGRRIIVSFGAKGVEQVDVMGRTVGLFAEPNDSVPENRCVPPPTKAVAAPKAPSGRPDTNVVLRSSPPSR